MLSGQNKGKGKWGRWAILVVKWVREVGYSDSEMSKGGGDCNSEVCEGGYSYAYSYNWSISWSATGTHVALHWYVHYSSEIVPEDELDVGVVLHEYKCAPVWQQAVEAGEGLATCDGVEAATRVGDMKMFAQRYFMLQYNANTVCVHPLLPVVI